jgi:hypothetical protein
MVLLAGCGGGPVDVTPPTPDTEVQAQCRTLLDALPAEVDGQESRDISPADALAAAWGDPPIELRCGVPKPDALTPTSFCLEVDGVGWLPTVDGQEDDMTSPPDATAVFTTIGRTAYVEVSVPPEWSPQPDVLPEMAHAVKTATREVAPCL